MSASMQRLGCADL